MHLKAVLTPVCVLPSQALVEQYATSENLEVQGRACEYKRTFGHDTIRSQLFEHMPALDESTYTRRVRGSHRCYHAVAPAIRARQAQSSMIATLNDELRAASLCLSSA